ncbi:subtilisin inhibitor-like [Prauserella shujinwangii]|uniref:Subtilisin inhibitor-like n=1 Tax=Prauserella shujinwangii TaxID=1453103 RepID=A0A2T0LNC0_9PSEU|nr:SSI family serine proteinase inhibitor [Prauserella shujinwangii]PRX44685.1 subtilisin inhibitor-like [Prauserella shujinwangii]
MFHGTRRRILVLVSALIVGTTAMASPAAAARPDGRLLLTVRDATTLRPLAVTVLTCAPDGGTHPHPAHACNALRIAGGDPARLRTLLAKTCLAIYQPVRAEAHGTWRRSPVRYSEVFGNRCLAAAETEDVFAF